ncbi:Lrp/AsnC family transcriptional regulator [uncultured Enterococcus sp.]|uniref:Lrp/AsnC family transcriptional regulator n=1 Tax=uncultured Enterococcus sp. TaxID=167972 RepID=UPI0025DA49A9|nr:Lrp/AsnC family transcriptional regulator [uncultured Enterococcus sp.]
MDHLDYQLLTLLQQDGRSSIKHLSERLFISGPAISQRIKQLEEQQVITGYHASLDYEQTNLAIKAYVQISVEPQQKPQFYTYIQDIPNILECDCVTGPYSMLLKVVFPTTSALDHFINRIQSFGRTNTQIVFSTPLPSRGFTFKKRDEQLD